MTSSAMPGPTPAAGLRIFILGEEVGDQRRRVLEVAVHDARPGAAGDPQALQHGAAEPVAAPLGRAVDEPDLAPALRAGVGHRLGGPVVGVVDDKHLGVNTSEGAVEAGQKWPDIAGLITRRNDNAQSGALAGLKLPRWRRVWPQLRSHHGLPSFL